MTGEREREVYIQISLRISDSGLVSLGRGATGDRRKKGKHESSLDQVTVSSLSHI